MLEGRVVWLGHLIKAELRVGDAEVSAIVGFGEAVVRVGNSLFFAT
jgi:hypothetical protein